MVHEIIISSRAEADLAAIELNIAIDNPAAARRHGDELVARIESLSEFPFQGSGLRWRKPLRKLVHGAYLIVYEVRENPSQVEILRIWHGARDPRSFRLREFATVYPAIVTQTSA